MTTALDTTAEIEQIAGEIRRNWAEARKADRELADDPAASAAAQERCGERDSKALDRLLAIAPTTARGLLAQMDTLFLERERRDREAARVLAERGATTAEIFDNEAVIYARCRRLIERLVESEGSGNSAIVVTDTLGPLVRCYDATKAIVASFGDRGADPPDSVWSLQRDTAKAIADTPSAGINDLAAKVAAFWHEAIDRDDLADAMTDPAAVAVLRSILADIERLAGSVELGDAS